MTNKTQDWEAKCRRSLMAALAEVRTGIARIAGADFAGVPPSESVLVYATRPAHRLIVPVSFTESDDDESEPAALDRLCSVFSLSTFERAMLLLCAGVELCPDFPALCSAANGDQRMNHATLSLALAAFPEPDWSALTPSSTLRRWRLIEVGAGERLMSSPLRIDERVLHFLSGVSYLDERLQGLIKPCVAPLELPESQRVAVVRVAEAWSDKTELGALAVIQLCGNDATGKRAVAAVACTAMGLQLRAVRAADLPSASSERDAFARLWEREALLADCALLVDEDDTTSSEIARGILSFVESAQSFLFVTCAEPLRSRRRPIERIDVNRPSAGEQKAIWRRALGEAAERLNGNLDLVSTQFDLSLHSINVVSEEVLRQWRHGQDREFGRMLWEACRRQLRPKLDDLAQRIQPAATWDDLVLPEAQLQVLRSIAAHVRWRALVYEGWGFASKGARGLGISALFSGASGTGKTMAAEVLANELRLDLYRIDLSAIVSKYIGETEKNLRRVFEAAEEGGSILLFDEADALFGKRSEVKDSHDRYANIEVSYLLQKIEAYRGLAVLTSNLKNAVDQAFMRRIRFLVHFPFPDNLQRIEIWRRIFPGSMPMEELSFEKLARLNLTGGSIRNLALNAAFLAADAGEPVRMKHLLAAAQCEYTKLERQLSEAEVGGWV